MPDTINAETGPLDLRIATICNLIDSPVEIPEGDRPGSPLNGALELMGLWLGIDAERRDHLLDYARKLLAQA